MRPLRLLAGGLAVIALWGICLQLMLRKQDDATPRTLQPAANALPLTSQPNPNIQLVSYDQVGTTSVAVPATTAALAPPLTAAASQPKSIVSGTPLLVTQIKDDTGAIWQKPAFSEAWLKSRSLQIFVDLTAADVDFAQVKDELENDIGSQLSKTQVGSRMIFTVPVPVTIGPTVYLHVDLIPVSAANPKSYVRIKFRADTSSPWKLHLRNNTDLPLPPQVVKLKLGTQYPTLPISFDRTAAPLKAQLFNDTAAAVSLEVLCQANTDRLTIVEMDQSSIDGKIVRSVTPAVVGDASSKLIQLHIDPTTLRNTDSTIQLEVIAEQSDGKFSFANTAVELKRSAVQPRPAAVDNFVIKSVSHANVPAEASPASSPKIFYTTNQSVRPSAVLTCNYAPETEAAPLAWALYCNGKACTSPKTLKNDGDISLSDLLLDEGMNAIQARVFKCEQLLNSFDIGYIDVKTGGFRVRAVDPNDFGTVISSKTIFVDFTRPPKTTTNDLKTELTPKFLILNSTTGEFDPRSTTTPKTPNTVELQGTVVKLNYTAPDAGSYLVRVFGDQFKDAYGNVLEDANGRAGAVIEARLGNLVTQASASTPVTPGVTRGQAPIVDYPPFVEPGKQPKGFNPNDRVETRVARLYFYRDAHRVAQILNRRAQSYNRQDVTMRRQFADKARQEADSQTTARQTLERTAVETAKKTRDLQNQLSDVQRSMNYSLQQMQTVARSVPPNADDQQRQQAQQQLSQLEAATLALSSQSQQLESQLRLARDTEVAANEQMQQAQRGEELARAEQFRLETAAAHSDPDTFAAGDPANIDQVAQVSISVIGEGLLHLRGPLRGVNQVRIMIDQMDAPCGQTRINIHSTQINGEEAAKLEVVANRIQTYIDQARFLTMQSGELLRKAVVHSASIKAEDARSLYPSETQADRDQRYLYAFFGKDFAEELRAMDSEFLRSGNKLLSLHSMDVTSLSSALMLMALANNGSRQAIMDEFDQLLQTELPRAEQQYIHNGIGCCTPDCKAGCKKHKQAPPLCYLSRNATFTSLKGFFNTQMSHEDTMSPLQREMIRLAQILKARLVTEMEYKQRVMERGLIEERLDSAVDSNTQLERERRTQETLVAARDALVQARSVVIPATSRLIAVPDQANAILSSARPPISELMGILNVMFPGETTGEANIARVKATIIRRSGERAEEYHSVIDSGQNLQLKSTQLADTPKTALTLLPQRDGANSFYRLAAATGAPLDGVVDDYVYLMLRDSERQALLNRLARIGESLGRVRSTIAPFHAPGSEAMTSLDELVKLTSGSKLFVETNRNVSIDGYYPVATIRRIIEILNLIEPLLARADNLRAEGEKARKTLDSFVTAFSRFEENAPGRQTRLERATAVYRLWSEFSLTIKSFYEGDAVSAERSDVLRVVNQGTEELDRWMTALGRLDAAYALAQDARRPLDHKKFLDMLIDDLEEKYIELLEGTRAHTANIDNYLKRLTTALDDDFNTQFYFHAFRMVREASQFKDVTFGQTETTNVLANNRELGKVSPAATMEFDLPKRDILINEGLNAALATYNDVGALVNDPNLMALAKLNSGQSGASPAPGSLGGYGAVRSVYPGLNTDVSGRLINQNAGSGHEFESNVEKLIPDPAIYKFETGTGFEIRPVIAPDGQAVVFDFNYMYTTQVREPVRADEKHLGRVKQHFVDTDVQLSNFELREVSRYVVALRASRTAKGVPLLEDIPVVGALWRPLPSDEKSLQQNIIMAQATIFPTLFDLMGLRWAQAISDLDPLRLSNREYLVRSRHQYLENRVYDYSSSSVDEFLRIPDEIRRPDLYRSQETIPSVHPNGYRGPGLDLEVSAMREGFNPEAGYTPPGFIPSSSAEGASYLPNRPNYDQLPMGETPVPMPSQPPRLQLSPSNGSPSTSSSRLQNNGTNWETKRVK